MAITSPAQLRGALVPRVQGCDAGRLHGFHARIKGMYVSLDPTQMWFGDFTGDGVSDALVAVTCVPGASAWPQTLVLYTGRDRPVGTFALSRISGATEFAQVKALHMIPGGGATVRWVSGDGCCDYVSRWSGTVTWVRHTLHVTSPGPESIDYNTSRTQSGPHQGDPGYLTSPSGVDRQLGAAPATLKAFAAARLRALRHAKLGQGCGPRITMRKYLASGWASGDEGCAGTGFVWRRIGGSWKEVLQWMDLPACQDLRRAQVPPAVYHALIASTCATQAGKPARY